MCGCLFFCEDASGSPNRLGMERRSRPHSPPPWDDILMNRSRLLPFAALLLIAGIASPAASQEQRDKPDKPSVAPSEQKSSRDYQDSAATSPKKSIAQQRAEYYGRQRVARLESLRRQGISVARPTVYGLPFTNSSRTSRPYRRCYCF